MESSCLHKCKFLRLQKQSLDCKFIELLYGFWKGLKMTPSKRKVWLSSKIASLKGRLTTAGRRPFSEFFFYSDASWFCDFCVRPENPCFCCLWLPHLGCSCFFFFCHTFVLQGIVSTLTMLRNKVYQIARVPVVGDRLVLLDVLEYLPLGWSMGLHRYAALSF